MTHDLVTTFTNGLGKEHDWTYKNVNADLPAAQLKEACELLTQLDIFEKNGVKLFDTVVTGKIVTTYDHEIFDLENEPKVDVNTPAEQLNKEAAIKLEIEQPHEKAASKAEAPTKPEEAVHLEKAAIPAKTNRSYDNVFEPTRTAIERKLEGPAETGSNQNSLIIQSTEIGDKHTIDCNEQPAEVSSTSMTAQSDEQEHMSPQQRLLAWVRRKKSRNKDDPDIHSH
ncbi:DUF2922 family protein [Enterococcus hulanensis]|uniref:DUF2922 family protein n=1 Tax=Enterococcus hulanensis TaxID=2559929 RepID=UPI00288F6CE4|nr:DUF2922 family protein [Enterococcus hulanensis]MDT2659135.1 DUF2922 family protein [Enterococcus hulanensis]